MKKEINNLLSMVLFLFVPGVVGCTKDNKKGDNLESLEYFYSNSSSLKIDVAYEPGAEPYVNSGFGGSNNFEFTLNNINNLFSGRSNTISVFTDMGLGDMLSIPSQNKTSFTQSEILALGEEYQTLESSEDQGVIFVLFLDGYFKFNGQEQTDVLGVSVGSFVVAIFKPVISAIPGGGIIGGDPKPQVEQATVVHEVGHAVGLVDNGVVMHTDHLDGAHGKHCDNQNCVMFWANEGSSGAISLFGGAAVTELIFGQECIDDITNF